MKSLFGVFASTVALLASTSVAFGTDSIEISNRGYHATVYALYKGGASKCEAPLSSSDMRKATQVNTWPPSDVAFERYPGRVCMYQGTEAEHELGSITRLSADAAYQVTNSDLDWKIVQSGSPSCATEFCVCNDTGC